MTIDRIIELQKEQLKRYKALKLSCDTCIDDEVIQAQEEAIKICIGYKKTVDTYEEYKKTLIHLFHENNRHISILTTRIRAYRERLEHLENTIRTERQAYVSVKDEIEKLKNVLNILNILFEFEVDVETETVYCCLGSVSLSGLTAIDQDLQLIIEVLQCLKN